LKFFAIITTLILVVPYR